MMIETYVPINKLSVNKYQQVFFVKEVSVKTDKNKKTYAKLVISDVTGTMTGYCWNYKAGQIEGGNFYLMEVSVQNNKLVNPLKIELQFYVEQDSVSLYGETPLNLEDYFTCPNLNLINHAASQLEQIIQQNLDGYYSNVIGNAVYHGLMNELKNSAYGTSGKLAIQGGLLIHTLRVVKGALALASVYEEDNIELDKSLIIVSALLRNIGWSKIYLASGNQVKMNKKSSMLTVESATLFEITSIINSAKLDLSLGVDEYKTMQLINSCYDSLEKIQTVEGKIVFLANKAAQVAG